MVNNIGMNFSSNEESIVYARLIFCKVNFYVLLEICNFPFFLKESYNFFFVSPSVYRILPRDINSDRSVLA